MNKEICALSEVLRHEHRKVIPRHNALGALALPPPERFSFLEACGLRVKIFFRPRIIKMTSDGNSYGISIVPGLAREILAVDGNPGLRTFLRPTTDAKTTLKIIYEYYKHRRLI